jgi:hypothetical protein
MEGEKFSGRFADLLLEIGNGLGFFIRVPALNMYAPPHYARLFLFRKISQSFVFLYILHRSNQLTTIYRPTLTAFSLKGSNPIKNRTRKF